MRPSGAHTHPEMGGGGCAVALAIAAAVLAASIAAPAARAAGQILHVVADVLEVLAIALASAAGLAVVACLVFLAARLRHHHQLHMAAYPVPRAGLVTRKASVEFSTLRQPAPGIGNGPGVGYQATVEEALAGTRPVIHPLPGSQRLLPGFPEAPAISRATPGASENQASTTTETGPD